jgi:hypothetical protein
MNYVWVNFAVWLGLTGVSVFNKVSGAIRSRRFNREYSDPWYKVTAFTFLIAFCFSFLAYVGTKSREKKNIFTIYMLLMFVVGSTWFMQYARLTTTLTDSQGFPLDVSRWIEWNHDQALL